jgi:AraC-like DNA-binding protein
MSDHTRYREIAPSAVLAPFVRCLWHLSGGTEPTRDPQPIVPDGCVEIVLNCADPFLRVNGGAHRQPGAMLVGQLTGPVVVVPTGAVDVWGVRLHPWGAAACLRMPLVELRESTVPLAEVLNADLADELHEGVGTDGIPALSATLERWLSRRPPPDRGARAAVELIARGRSLPSVRSIGAQLGRSTRWVQRTFRETVGLSPKMLSRIGRVQRAMRLATSRPAKTWSSIAADVGYFDQSHLVRDFRHIVGLTPSAFAARELHITVAFIESEPPGRAAPLERGPKRLFPRAPEPPGR